MPRRFSEQEREVIRTLLVREGRKLFGAHGLRKTNIGDLSKAAGIAQGTFYNFFHSKEELYFHIIEKEQEKSEQQFIDIVKSSASAKEALMRIILGLSDLIQTNSLLRNMIENTDYEIMLRALSREELERHQADDAVRVSRIIQLMRSRWQSFDVTATMFAGLLRSVAILSLHRNEIGAEVCPQIIELLAGLISGYLAREE